MNASRFVRSRKKKGGSILPAISLFTGGGISDIGFEAAGFRFLVQAEIDPDRAQLCRENFPNSVCVEGDLRKASVQRLIVNTYQNKTKKRLSLLAITPPCQGMSSSNPGRGKIKDSDDVTKDKRNLLLLKSIPIIKALVPRIIVVENVPFALNKEIRLKRNGVKRKLATIFIDKNPEYDFFSAILQMADYGVPQLRKRAVIVGVHRDEPWIKTLRETNSLPLPKKTHVQKAKNNSLKWVTLEKWFGSFRYPKLDSRNAQKARDERDLLHEVPHYDELRYSWISSIPKKSGKSAYENSKCPWCGQDNIPIRRIRCPQCKSFLVNRPHVAGKSGNKRLIRGFKSSYRRMAANLPARTITTNTSHLGGDYKIHPWENRVLSPREVAELQTVPRYYDWSPARERNKSYLIREVVGEAFPPYFTYILGHKLVRFLTEKSIVIKRLKLMKNGKTISSNVSQR